MALITVSILLRAKQISKQHFRLPKLYFPPDSLQLKHLNRNSKLETIHQVKDCWDNGTMEILHLEFIKTRARRYIWLT